MVDKVRVKIYEYKGRHTLNLPSEFVKDSTFPFKRDEELVAHIDGGKVVIQRAGKRGTGGRSP